MKILDEHSQDFIFLWLMHRIAEVFKDHAILKGGQLLRLFECPRQTSDLVYTFIPYKSKNEIVDELLKLVNELEGAEIRHTLNSKTLTILIKTKNISLQIEANVALECRSIAATTNALCRPLNQIPRVISIMSPDVALSHKMAAWNERRLIRDLYDIYYFYRIIGAMPDLTVLEKRLTRIESRIPKLKSKKKMTLTELKFEISNTVNQLKMEEVKAELFGTLPSEEMPNLDLKIRAAVNELMEKIVN